VTALTQLNGPAGPSSAAGSLLTGGQGSDYTARHLLVLEGLEAVRKRPGMYIGSTDSRGLMHCVWEIIDNSVDEALVGYCTRIDIVLRDDGSVEKLTAHPEKLALLRLTRCGHHLRESLEDCRAGFAELCSEPIR